MNNLDLQAYLSELETLVNIDSGTKDKAGTEKVADYFVERFQAIGWQVERKHIDDSVGRCLAITNKKADNYDLLMIGHMDTVFPAGTAKERPFKNDGKRLYGPGVNDMKSALLYAYHIAKNLTENNLLGDKAVAILFNSDEEISSRYSRPLIEEWSRKAKYAIVLEPARINGALVKQRKGVGKYFVDFNGIASHSGVSPELGASAIHEMGRWIVALAAMNNPAEGTVVNIGVVGGGTAPNVVAEHARFEMDIRITKIEEAEKIEKLMQEMAAKPQIEKVKIDIKGGVSRPPMYPTKQNLEFCAIVDEVAKTLGIEFEWIATGGGSDANFSSNLGVPTIDGLGPTGGFAHTVNEYVELDAIIPRFELLLGTVKKLMLK